MAFSEAIQKKREMEKYSSGLSFYPLSINRENRGK